LKYHQGSIKTHIKEVINYDSYYIIRAIDKSFKVGERYKKADIKEGIQSIYKSLEIDKVAKATDINEYFKNKDCKMSDKTNGLLIEGKLYNIINE